MNKKAKETTEKAAGHKEMISKSKTGQKGGVDLRDVDLAQGRHGITEAAMMIATGIGVDIRGTGMAIGRGMVIGGGSVGGMLRVPLPTATIATKEEDMMNMIDRDVDRIEMKNILN